MNPNPPTPPQYSLQNLLTYFQLVEQITGKKPTHITVSNECLVWYREQRTQVVKNFNIPTTKNFKEDEFMGVELVTKE